MALTVEGQVFAWGKNNFGQLGINDETVAVVIEPMACCFKEKTNVVSIAAGNNHCIALSDEGLVFMWGRRMGIYPSVESLNEINYVRVGEIN